MIQTVTNVLKLQESQIEQGADLLAQVFQYDPMMQFLVNDPAKMLEKPRPLYRASIRTGLLCGQVYTTKGLDAIAVWIEPGNTDFTFWQMLQTGLLRATLAMGLASVPRALRAADYLEQIKKQVVPEPHWMLMFIGVEESKRGLGIGQTLLQPVLDRADTEESAIYLDSMNERNLNFYKRNGFDIVAEGRVPKGGPQFWTMLRSHNKARSDRDEWKNNHCSQL